MNFSDLNLGDVTKSISPIVKIGKIDFKKDVLKKVTKRKKEELRIIEPGFKVGTGQFLTIAQWCNVCENVMSHAHKPEKRKLICLGCKVVKNY